MGADTNFNQSPYFDDFDATKDYYRILFKPGLAVQTRELTQLQSILQNQIESMGDNIFTDGTIVDGCDFQYDDEIQYVKLRDEDSGGNTVAVGVFANTVVEGRTSGVRAKVVETVAGSEASAPNYNTFLVKYISGGTDNVHKTFDANEVIVYKPADGGEGQEANTISSGAFGTGTRFSVGDGTIYAKGHYLRVAAQSIILEKYNTSPSYQVGFKIVESTVNSDTDSTLLDNATGSYNYSAPGADRLKLYPTLIKRSLTDTANTDPFTFFFEVENGNIRQALKDTVYDQVGRELAKRTYEESGNYWLKPINIRVQEHLDDGTNFGRYKTTDTPAGDSSKLAVAIEPGIAYVQGYRNEILSTDYINADKGTDTREELGLTVTANYGNYVEVSHVAGPWDPTLQQSISLRSAISSAVTTGNFGSGAAPGSEIGTARLRMIKHVSGTPSFPSARYYAYIYDVVMTSGNTFSDVRALYVNNGSGNDCFADVVLDSNDRAVLVDTSFNKSLFSTGVKATKRLRDENGTNNTNYIFRDKATVSFATGGTATLSITGAHAGGTEEYPYGVGALSTTQKRDFIVVADNTMTTANNSGTMTWNGLVGNVIVGNASSSFNTEYKVGDFFVASNASASSTGTLRVVSIAGASSMVVTPRPAANAGLGGAGATHAKVFPAGYVFDMSANGSSGSTRSITINTTTSATLDLKETITGSTDATVFFNNKREQAVAASKTVRKSRFVKLDLSSHGAGISGPWSLGQSDVFNIRNVYIGPDFATTNKNVTTKFRLDRNQNDSYYGISWLRLKEGAGLTLKTTDRLLVEFDYFKQDVSSGIGFYSVDSYVIDPNESTANTTAIVTAQIPQYTSTSSGATFDLRDTIDFRPHVANTAGDHISVGSATTNPTTGSTLDIDSDGSYVPVIDENFTADLEYYLPRIDRVVIGKDGKKRVIKGIPNEIPRTPPQVAETMTLAYLGIKPYPSLSLDNAKVLNRIDLAVKVTPESNKRFTMKDVGRLERRIDKLEYYTALNVLETATKDLFIGDGSGLDRFKNGIFVDRFFGHDLGNIADPTYRIAIDPSKGELRPRFDQQNIDLTLASNTTNIYQRALDVRLEVTGNTGHYANDDNVYVGSSFGSATATGIVKHVVANTSAVRLYLEEKTGTFNTSSTLKNNTRAGESTISQVQLPEMGELMTLPYTHMQYINQPFASKQRNPVGELLFNWVGEIDLFPEADHWVDTTTQPDANFELDLASNWQSAAQSFGTMWNEWETRSSRSETTQDTLAWIGGFDSLVDFVNPDGTGAHGHVDVVQNTNTTVEQQTRTGTRLNVEPFTRTQSTGPFVTSVEFIPFMRSRAVRFHGKNLRPSTRVYPYFDSIRVENFCVPTNSSYANTSSPGSALVTNSNGDVYGIFIVPNTTSLRFRMGQRPFRLMDVANTQTGSNTATTSAQAIYSAQGLATSERGITMTTREARVSSQTVSEERTQTTTTDLGTGIIPHRDPIAQTFFVGRFESQNLSFGDNFLGAGADGVFVSKIDLFFARKSATFPISVELREVQNGVITTSAVPFGFSTVAAADVNVSSDASAATPFVFKSPVYLRGDREYAFIVKPAGSNPDYLIWLSALGEIDVLTGRRIVEQPASGMLFTSANDRTYVPRQNEDIKFKIHRATFDTSVTGTAIMSNEDDDYFNIDNISASGFEVNEKVRGESELVLYNVTGNTAAVSVNDFIAKSSGANTGRVRKIVTSNATSVVVKADLNGAYGTGANVSLTSANGSVTYYGTANGFTTNTATGFIQFFDRGNATLIINASSGSFSSNTTGENGYIRGLVSNASAQVTSVRDIKYDLIQPKITELVPIGTTINWSAKSTSNTYNISSTYGSGIENINNNDFFSGEKIVASKTNEVTNTSGAKTLAVKGVLTSNNEKLSPVIDYGRAKSTILIHNIINNDTTGETGNQGSASARYISKRVTLADGQEAEDIKVFVTAYKPTGTGISVYGRVHNAEDSESFSDKQYTLLNQVTAANTISSLTNKEDFVELEFGVPSINATSQSAFLYSANNNVIRYADSAGAQFDTFKSFSIKIVLTTSVGSQTIPRVRDLRAVALQQ